MLGSISAIFLVQRDDDFAVAVGFEIVWALELLAQDSVVVDFSIDGQGNGALVVDQWLGAGVDADDAQALMAEDGVVASPVAGPVGPTVS